MSEETIKILNMINDKVEKCMKDNNVDTLLAIPLGGDGSFGYLTNKMLKEIIQLQQEKQQLKEKTEWYEKENKHNQEIIIKDTKVLDEIREYITEDLEEPDPEVYQEYTVDISWFTDLLQILDKVKE